MIKLAKIVDTETGLCQVALGDNTEWFSSLGFTEQDVKLSDLDNQYYLVEKCPMKSETQKNNELNHLTMTALDLITAIKSLGLTDDDVETFLNNNLGLKHQLTYCKDVYCGIVRQLCPIVVKDITITDELIVNLFKQKHNLT